MISLKVRLSGLILVGVVAASLFNVSFADTTSGGEKVIICPGNSGVTESKKFVYCGPSLCTPDYDRQGKATGKATCNDCYEMTGDNLGTLSCEQRVPNNDIFISSFSARKALDKGRVKQPMVFCGSEQGADDTYADCLNAKCKVNEQTGQATCSCSIVTMRHKGVYGTQTRSCDVNKCNARSGYILNGAPAALVAQMVTAISSTTDQSVDDLTCKTYRDKYPQYDKVVSA